MATYVNLATLSEGLQGHVAFVNYTLLQHGYGNTDYVLMARSYAYSTTPWVTSLSARRDSYEGSRIDEQNNNHLASGLSDIEGIIPTVPIEIRDIGGQTRTINRRVFALSKREVGLSNSGPGSPISWFNGNERRIYRWQPDVSNRAEVWWLRDPVSGFLGRMAEQVSDKGQSDTALQEAGQYYYRPAFCLPKNTIVEVNDPFTRITSSISPVVGGSITVNGGSSIIAGVPFNVTWGAATGDGYPISYHLYCSYDNGATWALAAPPTTSTNATFTIPMNDAQTVKYKLTAVGAYSVESLNSIMSANVTVTTPNTPAPPPKITASTPPLQRGGPVTVTWSASPSSDLSHYVLEHSSDGGNTWTQTYSGNALTWSGTLGQWSSVQYRVKAVDIYGQSSGYTTSISYPMQVPVQITVAQHSSSGLKNNQTYTTDTARTVVFAVSNTADTNMTGRYSTQLRLDGTLVSSTTNAVITGGTFTYSLTKFQWQTLLNGSHAYTLTVTASGNSGQGSITFTKNVTQIILKREPFEVSITAGIIKNVMMTILGSFPAGSTLLVEITNNAKDSTPVWQEVLPGQLGGTYFEITNTTVTNGNWFALRVTVNRGTATATCWIAQISGVAGMSMVFTLSEDNAQLREDFDNKALKLLGSVSNYASLPTSPEIRLTGGIWKTNDTERYWCWTGDAWLEAFPQYDTAPVQNSTKGITSGAVAAALAVITSRLDGIEATLAALAEALDPQNP